jgi:pimeloyl-ACP methyl ester carboxylesterase
MHGKRLKGALSEHLGVGLASAVALSAGMALVALAFDAVPAEARLRFERCRPSGFRCARLAVPLDRSGAVGGRVSLLVERHRARRARRPPVFALAGGPGQSATLGAEEFPSLFGRAARDRDLIAFDQRGTGRSGLLRCPPLERTREAGLGDAVADCARRLGARSSLYTTRDSVADIEAVRRALGAKRIALFGVSYGTKVALAYAMAYPGRVERLALDSVVELDGPSALDLPSFAATPRVLSALCLGGGCRRITPDPTRDLEQLVARLASGPLQGHLVSRRGRRRRASLSRHELFDLLLAGSFDGGLRTPFPAAVRSALRGDAAPILRLERRAGDVADLIMRVPPRELSLATNVATSCEETSLPWPRTAPFADRRRQAAALIGSLPASLFRPFDRLTALGADLPRTCERWPAAPAPPLLTRGPAPDVPVLVLEGEDDLITPVESARRVAALFPSARLLVAQETGHDASDAEADCARRGLQRFFSGRRVTRACPRSPVRLNRPSPISPFSLGELRPVRRAPGLHGRALRALQLTVHDAAREADWVFHHAPYLRAVRGAGLRAGSLRYDSVDGRIGLKGYSFVPGVRVSGVLRDFHEERRVHGRLRIWGRGTPHGKLQVRGRRVRGRIGGRRVRARLSLDLVDGLASSATHHRHRVVGAPYGALGIGELSEALRRHARRAPTLARSSG